MTRCSPGDVVLVRFPFTDLTSAKQRPAVVVSSTEFTSKYGDVVVVAVTSREQAEPGLVLSEWKAAGLVKPTWFKPLIATLASGIIVRRLGALTQPDRKGLAGVLDRLVDSSVWKPRR